MLENTLIKKVRFDFLRDGKIGCCHVEVDCQTKEDLEQALEFAKEASNLMPAIGETIDEHQARSSESFNPTV